MRSAGRVVAALGAMLLAILMGATMADERGDALGIVTLFGWAAIAVALAAALWAYNVRRERRRSEPGLGGR
ncbi:MAG TPA: hypothetical protein VF715_05725 [Thermoleophilaceae bacterium]